MSVLTEDGYSLLAVGSLQTTTLTDTISNPYHFNTQSDARWQVGLGCSRGKGAPIFLQPGFRPRHLKNESDQIDAGATLSPLLLIKTPRL